MHLTTDKTGKPKLTGYLNWFDATYCVKGHYIDMITSYMGYANIYFETLLAFLYLLLNYLILLI